MSTIVFPQDRKKNQKSVKVGHVGEVTALQVVAGEGRFRETHRMMRRKTVPRRSLAACLAAAVLADICHKAPAADSTCPVDEHGAPCSSWSARVDAVDLPLVRKVDATISYPTGDPSFAVMEAFSGEQTLPAEFVSPFLLAHDFGTPTKDLNKPGPAHDHGPAITPDARTTGWHPHRGSSCMLGIRTCVHTCMRACARSLTCAHVRAGACIATQDSTSSRT